MRERRAAPHTPEDAVRTYAATRPQVERATREYVELVTTLLDEAGINYLAVTGRAKSIESFAAKAGRTVDGKPVYSDPLTQITDQIGVRVVTYVLADVDAVADVLADQLHVLDDRDMGLETAQAGGFGYRSRHVLVELDPDRAGREERAALAGRTASVQVRTVLQHAWAEFEHDTRYKGTIPEEHAPDLDRRFTLAAGLLELADREFLTIRDRLREGLPGAADEPDEDPRIGAQDLAAFLAGRFPDAGWSRTDHYAWASALLLELGITSLRELGEVLSTVDTTALNARMDYRYPPGAVRRLDDALLAVHGERYVELTGNAHRVTLLTARLARMRHDETRRSETRAASPRGE
ncbi:MAG: GTP pyrophosphokinase [Acidobacteria bacterium]|nr:MAG: GTP pyrophosphokinase [Acidobacteriota bacterium]